MASVRSLMFRTLEREAVSGVKHVSAVDPARADGVVGDLYREAREDYVIGGPMTLHSPSPRIFAGMWAVLRETLIVGHVPRAHKEAVAATVSRINRCPYCVEAHGLSVAGAGAAQAARAVETGSTAAIDDRHLRGLVAWAAATRRPGDPLLSDPPFDEHDRAEIVGTALAFHYINRMVSVFLGDSGLPFVGAVPALRGPARLSAGPMMRRILVRSPEPGRSLDRLPTAAVSDDFAWLGQSSVVTAFSALTAILDDEVESVLPATARAAVSDALGAWSGEEAPLGRQWAEDVVAALDPAARPAATIALLAALAPYRLSDADVTAFRLLHSEDQALLAVTGWGALSATRHIASWLSPVTGQAKACAG